MVRTDPQSRKITTLFSNQSQESSENQAMEEEYEIVEKERVPIRLASVRELREEVMEVVHNGMS